MKAFILRTIPYTEHAKLLYVYTAEGLKSMVARGVYKMDGPLRLTADPFKLFELEVSDRRLPSVKSAELLAHYPATKGHYEKTLMPHIIAETILKNVTDDDDHYKLFSLLIKVLEGIETHPDGFDYLMMFMLKLLYALGFGLRLGACHVCSATAGLGYDTRDLKTYCQAHLTDPGGVETYETLSTLLKADALTYNAKPRSKEEKKLLFQLIERLYADHLDFKAQSFQAFKAFLKESA